MTAPQTRRSFFGWLPPGTLPVAAGILVNGLATYIFLVLPARTGRLDPESFAIFSTLWFAAYLIGPGLYVPLEQELARLSASATALRRPADLVAARRAGLIFVAATTAVLGTLLLVFNDRVATTMFDDNHVVVVVLVASIVGSGLIQWAKGWLSGTHQFGRYGWVVGLEGALRAVAVIALVLVGAEAASAYTVPVALAPIAAVGVVLLWKRSDLGRSDSQPSDTPDSTITVRTVSSAIGVLVVAQLGAQFLMNAVPLTMQLLASSDEQDLVGRLGAALVIARVPLFLFQAVQAAFLPNLVAAVEAGDGDGFRRTVRLAVGGFTGLGVLGVGIGAALGPWVTRLMFGEEFNVSAIEFGSLVLAAMVIVIGLLFAQALIALGCHRSAALGWAAGVIAFVPALAVGADLVTRVLTAGVVAPLVALAVLVWQFATNSSLVERADN